MATIINGDNVDVPGQVTVHTAPTLADHVVRLADISGMIVAADPVAAPTNGANIVVNRVNGSLWYWDSVAASWIALIT